MLIDIVGRNLPGASWRREDGSIVDDVHVGLQVRREPTGVVRGDAAHARWETTVVVVDQDGTLDFRGPAVHGKRGERFLYITWGTVGREGVFEMFRRAKLMLDGIPTDLVRGAAGDGALRLIADVDLTDECGGPRCARVERPHLTWSVA